MNPRLCFFLRQIRNSLSGISSSKYCLHLPEPRGAFRRICHGRPGRIFFGGKRQIRACLGFEENSAGFKRHDTVPDVQPEVKAAACSSRAEEVSLSDRAVGVKQNQAKAPAYHQQGFLLAGSKVTMRGDV